ncbi:alpha/beta fold hydrolase [Streptomyces huiliensis]|uniref:alpha/beta fold hydrolase n=1 Tax=Streptomyces huiliensis TaxID=2876027 RepID=UPI001CBF8730|nr:alpha/beta hydrolase [Streptomyces huiliensis]MBZ4322255.1 alpha/beta hydrolase [Streptomyces huiliensis]
MRRTVVDGAGTGLSALLAEAAYPPRATVVALHGGGMTAGYFDCPADPRLSLLALGAALGYTVLAVDRPGYGRSAARYPEGRTLADQAAALHAALDDFARRHPVGAGVFVVAHSFGGKVALTAAADDPKGRLLGLDISGCGHRYAVDPRELPAPGGTWSWSKQWGRPGLYPPGVFRSLEALIAPLPPCEAREAARWPAAFPALARRVRAPVRLTFAEHEAWWRHDERELAGLAAAFGSARVLVDRQPAAGHNISLGTAARAYHLRALAFLEECLAPGGPP